MTDHTKQQLEQLGRTTYGSALREFLKERLESLNDVTMIESWDEALGKKYAVKLIKDLFSFMEEKKVDNKIKNQYV